MAPSKKNKEENQAPIHIEEIDESKNVVATYHTGLGGERVSVSFPENKVGFGRSVLNAFLPAGYPHSVTSDYLEYQIYDSLQAFSSSIAGMLSNRAVLEGIGVGDSHASPTSALLLSVLQESMGRIATILFAHRLGSSLEPECKMYRLLADIFNDSAMILDCFSPALPKGWRVTMLALSSCLRSLCGVAAGSSKASLSAHFAKVGNLGELNAKDSSQETVISLLGMLTGSLIISHITTKFATWSSLIFLLSIHLFTNYLAVRAVSMRTLNRQRANIVFTSLLKLPQTDKYDRDVKRILKPEDVSLQEKIFERDGVLGGVEYEITKVWDARSGHPNQPERKSVRGWCYIGVPLQKIISLFNSSSSSSPRHFPSPPVSDLTKLFELYKNDGYIMMCDSVPAPDTSYYVVIKEGAGNKQLLKGWFHALCHVHYWAVGRMEGEGLVEGLERTKENIEEMLEKDDIFGQLVNAGWDTETGALETRSGTRVRMLIGK